MSRISRSTDVRAALRSRQRGFLLCNPFTMHFTPLPISYVGAASALSGNLTYPAIQAGDLAWIFAVNGGIGTDPTLPSGYTVGSTYSSNQIVGRVREFYRFLDGSETGVSVSNSNSTAVIILRGALSPDPRGAASANGGSGLSPVYNAITCQQTNGSSAILRFGRSRNTNLCATDITVAGVTLATRTDTDTNKIAGGYALERTSIAAGNGASMCSSSSWNHFTITREIKQQV